MYSDRTIVVNLLTRIIQGFDEFMNIVVDEAFEVSQKDDTRTELGRILLKGDNITLISSLEAQTIKGGNASCYDTQRMYYRITLINGKTN